MMRLGKESALALRLLWRDFRAGELKLLIVAVLIAVGSLTTVGFFTSRVQLALTQQSNQLLGADLTIVSDRPFGAELAEEARRRGLSVTRALRFPSMVMHGADNLLSDVKAVADGYPLRGEVRLADRLFGEERVVHEVPAAGSAWVDDRMMTRLGIRAGDVLQLGQIKLRVAALLTQEPDSVIGFINSAPRLLMNEADIAASGLIQTGSRVRYRLYLAGDTAVIDEYRLWAQSRIVAGQNIEGIRDARPEIRSALDRAERFLGLAALLSVVLSAVAIALATRRFLLRHLDGCAVMRCLGARQAVIVRLYVVHFVLLGAAASAAGCGIGYGAQLALASMLEGLLAIALPWPGFLPAWQGLAAGVLLLLGFALPPLVSLGQVPLMRVLRRDLGVPGGAGLLSYTLGLAVICGLVIWKAQDLRLGFFMLGGFLAASLLSLIVVATVLRVLSHLRTEGNFSWRYGVANLRRRALGNTIQIVALALGIMALLTLTLIRGDLLQSWKATLRPDTPNRFVINIQEDQVEALAVFFSTKGMPKPVLAPMVRGRLVAVNGQAVSSANYTEDRAKRLIDREFNLSWAEKTPPDSRIDSGSWWRENDTQFDQLSVEDGIAQTLGLRLGDRLTYEVAGNRIEATITSLRKVDWDSFRVNFFVITPPRLLQGSPVSYITSFYVPQGQVETLNELVREFPNLVMIDVAQIMTQVQKMMDQVSTAVQFVFLFTLVAGLVVLYAAIASTTDEREYEAAIMRTLGASRRQIAATQFAEFALTGALAGALAAAGASGLGYVLATNVLNVPYLGNTWIWVIGIGAGSAGIALAGMLGTRHVLAVPPLQSLRRIA